MSDSYVECLVKAKQPAWAKILKVLLITLTVLSCLVMFVFIIFLPVALAAGVGAYFLNMYTDLEYEYLYLDKELSVDKIMAKSKRKRVGTYSLDRMEVFAPVYSYHLDNFKNRQVKEKDYSIGEVLQPDGRYAMYYEGGEKILLSLMRSWSRCSKTWHPAKCSANNISQQSGAGNSIKAVECLASQKYRSGVHDTPDLLYCRNRNKRSNMIAK